MCHCVHTVTHCAAVTIMEGLLFDPKFFTWTGWSQSAESDKQVARPARDGHARVEDRSREGYNLALRQVDFPQRLECSAAARILRWIAQRHLSSQ